MSEEEVEVEKATLISAEDVKVAAARLQDVVNHTPLLRSVNLSEKYQANIYLKREDLQVVRSYKLRGAYNKMSSLASEQLANGVVCASAGNHAQGVAYSCHKMGIKGHIFMPVTTPQQKLKQVQLFGKEHVEVVLTGDTFDDSYHQALEFSNKNNKVFIHPFNDPQVMAGQGTVGLEILEAMRQPIDLLLLPVGGGGLASGVSSYFREESPETTLIGIEPEGAPAMKKSIEAGRKITLDHIDKFVDGAAVKAVGDLTLQICRENLDKVITVPEGKVCSTILQLYNEEAMVVEPAGALSIAALDFFKDEIKGKTVVCVVSGGNNDITRTEEIKERSLLYEGLKHYFIVNFPQRAGALKEFVNDILGPTDDITHFEYTKKNSREKGPALVGIELKNPSDFDALVQRMAERNFNCEYINNRPEFYHFII
ncbi:threonine ammonia-lyase IlvA [Adhaeribacter radiodurans]|uniref:L-threonine dehydratase n=1 Tax=Adhaeribacter radiodurans TaxID=2745197 RepID=A0A7L7LGL9_9BACT|nr:threonine ammonia-lyase IlvA [Adhaeribacter radiodurans]QMU31665.1 threonine ammonia-lyase IlvA [Adhaeribacter radiodurans]